MRTIATALLVGALALWGCGEGNSKGNSGQGDASKGDPTTASHDATTGAKGADPKSAGTKSATQAPKPSEEDLDRSTAEGTINLFVLHMQQGEFQDALMLTDPESVGYVQIEQAVNVMGEAAKKSADGGITLEAMMRAFLSRGWHGAVCEPVTVQDDRARFEMKLVDHDVKTIDLRKIDGDWYVVAPEWIVNGVKGDISDLMPNTPSSGNEGQAAPPKPSTSPSSNGAGSGTSEK